VYLNLQVAPQHHADVTVAIDTFGVAIAAKSADGIKHFDIRLDPPELGRVEIRLSLDDSGKAQANLVVDKPQTLELLQRDASALTQSLNDAGVSLSNNGLNFSLRGQDRQSDSGSVAKGRSRSLSVKALVGTDAISNSGSIDSLALDSARLDIRV
jgi:flagellar hook-length control protein FliK